MEGSRIFIFLATHYPLVLLTRVSREEGGVLLAPPVGGGNALRSVPRRRRRNFCVRAFALGNTVAVAASLLGGRRRRPSSVQREQRRRRPRRPSSMSQSEMDRMRTRQLCPLGGLARPLTRTELDATFAMLRRARGSWLGSYPGGFHKQIL